MGEITSLTKASPKTKSLRTTVPNSIVKQFNLTEKDILEWQLEAKSEGKMIIVVKPIKTEIAETTKRD
jgi:bifunctional DNA-binding transcriptional regulator/antitoxin component of YhaV-PrlF toxin-antitoxin module